MYKKSLLIFAIFIFLSLQKSDAFDPAGEYNSTLYKFMIEKRIDPGSNQRFFFGSGWKGINGISVYPCANRMTCCRVDCAAADGTCPGPLVTTTEYTTTTACLTAAGAASTGTYCRNDQTGTCIEGCKRYTCPDGTTTSCTATVRCLRYLTIP